MEFTIILLLCPQYMNKLSPNVAKQTFYHFNLRILDMMLSLSTMEMTFLESWEGNDIP